MKNNSSESRRNESDPFDLLFGCDLAGPESPLEEFLEEKLLPLLDLKTVSFQRQFKVSTTGGKFRLDYALKCNSVYLGLECDGKEFHDTEHDLWRDALIIGDTEITDIIRITGSQIYRNVYCCIYLIMRIYPQLFIRNERKRVSSLAVEELRDWLSGKKERHGDIADFSYERDDEVSDMPREVSEKDIEGSAYITRRKSQLSQLAPLIAFARKNKGYNISQLIRLYG